MRPRGVIAGALPRVLGSKTCDGASNRRGPSPPTPLPAARGEGRTVNSMQRLVAARYNRGRRGGIYLTTWS
jgi:hypothetical protein